MLRAVADTNIVVSALLDELADALARDKFAARRAASGLTVDALVHRYARLATQVLPAEISPAVPGDPDDDQVLACALAAGADLVISGDKRVRNLKHYHGIRIVDAAQALSLISAKT